MAEGKAGRRPFKYALPFQHTCCVPETLLGNLKKHSLAQSS